MAIRAFVFIADPWNLALATIATMHRPFLASTLCADMGDGESAPSPLALAARMTRQFRG